MRIKFFWYKHPKTGEMFSDQRMVGYEDKPFNCKGIDCELVRGYAPPEVDHDRNLAIINKNREVFEADPWLVKKTNPKYVKYQDGHSERFDPNRHC